MNRIENPESQYADDYLDVNARRGEDHGYTIGTYLAHRLSGKAKKYGAGYQRALQNAMKKRVLAGTAYQGTSERGGVAYYPIAANPTRSARKKRKRSAKQRANDRRLGRMAKARAAKRRKRPAKRRRRNPRTWIVFKCQDGKVRYLGDGSTVPLVWKDRISGAHHWQTKSAAQRALQAAAARDARAGPWSWVYGIAAGTALSSEIKAHCRAGKR